MEEKFRDDSLEFAIQDGETVLWEGSPKKSAYIIEGVFRMLPIVLLWAAFDTGFLVMMTSFGIFRQVPWLLYIIIPFMALHLAPVWIWVYGIFKRAAEHKNIRYAVTDRRILIRQGLIGIDYRTVNYKDIGNVKLHVGPDDKMLKVGDIHLYGDRSHEVLFDVGEPYKAYKIIQKIVLDMQADMLFPNDLRPQTNSGYRTKYGGEEGVPAGSDDRLFRSGSGKDEVNR